MKNIIEIKNLKKHFKDVKAVDDISFDVREGQLFAFLGLNGAGKSTTISILAGSLQKDSGQVFVDGLSIDQDMRKITPKLGVVFQSSVLDSKLTVFDNLKYRAHLYDMEESQFKQNLAFLAERLEFSEILKRPLCKLSGGQKRRVDIARALIHNPSILILDEPTTGLDPKTRILVWDLIGELRKNKNMTVLLTTHYMEEAAEADYVVIIDCGKIVASDTPNNLKNEFAYDFVKIYSFDKKLLKALEKENLPFKVEKEIIEIEVKTTQQAKELLVTYKDFIFDFEVVKGKMDNVFLNVTGKRLAEV